MIELQCRLSDQGKAEIDRADMNLKEISAFLQCIWNAKSEPLVIWMEEPIEQEFTTNLKSYRLNRWEVYL